MGDTIAAIATPQGEGGIGIVRVSGELVPEIMRKVFGGCPENVTPRHAYYGMVRDVSGSDIDEAICIYMKAPNSYTCEDVLELQSHGGLVSTRKILRSVLDAGARIAEPGEFTKLAFMNGRIDLTQAEAVIDMISAKSEMPHRIALGQLEGRLGSEVRRIRADLIDTLAQMAVNIDFPDEDIEQRSYEQLINVMKAEILSIDKLISSADTGRIARDGIKAVITGKPNVGKSSLLNEILGEGRAIVTDIPGTTRDTIEEAASVSGVPIVLVDTAGIRDADDEIERIGIDRSRRELEMADIVIMVIDGSAGLTDEDFAIFDEIKEKKTVAVINKKDLGTCVSPSEIKKMIPDAEVITTSLISPGGGVDLIERAIEKMFFEGGMRSECGNVVTNERQIAALKQAESSLSASADMLKKNEPLEIAEIDAHSALDSLGEVIGEAAGEEILDAVFSKFCLGK